MVIYVNSTLLLDEHVFMLLQMIYVTIFMNLQVLHCIVILCLRTKLVVVTNVRESPLTKLTCV